MPLVLDLEQADGLGADAVWAWVQAFMGRVHELTGRPGVIYVGYYFWADQVCFHIFLLVRATPTLDCASFCYSRYSPTSI